MAKASRNVHHTPYIRLKEKEISCQYKINCEKKTVKLSTCVEPVAVKKVIYHLLFVTLF